MITTEVDMKVRCNLCGKIFSSEAEYLDGEHDKRVHDHAEPTSYAMPLSIKTKQTIQVEDLDAIR